MYQSWSVVFGEQPTAAKWNILGTNDASFNNGTGLPTAGADGAIVATSEATTSTSYADLATTTDTITVAVGANGKVMVGMSASMAQNTQNSAIYVGYTMSGANSVAAADSQCMSFTAYTNNVGFVMGSPFFLEALTPGSTTFKMKYRVSGGTGTFSNRRIFAIPL